MIYFENYWKGNAGFNNHLVSYTLCLSLSHFLDRDFYFEHEIPCFSPPDFALREPFKKKFEILMTSRRSLVSDLVKIPSRRVTEIDRTIENKITIADPSGVFLTADAMRQQFEGTVIWDQFSLGRRAILREQIENADLIEFGADESLVNASYFYFLPRKIKDEVLKSIQIRYSDDIERLADRISRSIGDHNAIHLRRGDFFTEFGDATKVDIETAKRYLAANIEDASLPLLVATDGLHEKEFFAELLQGHNYIFIDDLIFDEFRSDFERLEFTDFNVLTILNQLICAASSSFVGTCLSTFTSIIHRLRQERYDKRDFNFFPDQLISRFLTEDFKIAGDAKGFFEWNWYSVFGQHHRYPGWMREWDYSKTSLA